MLGSWLYVVLSTLLFYRLAFVRLAGEEIRAAYWVSIGAGATVHTPALVDLRPFVKAYSVLF